MTRPPQPTERFAQHSRLAELITALGFRRYLLFLTGLLYQEPGGPLRQATAVANRDGDLVAYDSARSSSLPGTSRPRGCSTTTSPGRPARPGGGWSPPWPTTTRRSSPTRWPAGPGTGRTDGTARPMSAEGSALCEGWARC